MELTGIILCFALSAWLTWSFSRPASRFYFLDHPGERSLHAQPMPRSGGLAILAGVVSALALAAWRYNPGERIIWLSLGVLLVATVSYLDDRHGLPAIKRLWAHIAAAVLLLWGGFTLSSVAMSGAEYSVSGALVTILSLAAIVWMINLYNFMDGLDGLAGGMAVIGFGFLALLGWQAGNPLFAWLNLATAVSAAGFLIFNFPPARVFMGDTGSSMLGLLAAAFSLWGAQDGVFPLWVPILVFSAFIADATVTLIRRLFGGEKIWKAHRTHYYQKLVLAGWGHRKTLFVEYAVMLACGITACAGIHAPVKLQVMALAGWVLFYLGFFSWISWYASGSRSGSA